MQHHDNSGVVVRNICLFEDIESGKRSCLFPVRYGSTGSMTPVVVSKKPIPEQ